MCRQKTLSGTKDNGNAVGIIFTATGSSGKILMQIFMMQKQIHFING